MTLQDVLSHLIKDNLYKSSYFFLLTAETLTQKIVHADSSVKSETSLNATSAPTGTEIFRVTCFPHENERSIT